MYEKENTTPMDFRDATVWLSNPWYIAAPVEIRNFTLNGHRLPESRSINHQPGEIMGRSKLSEFAGKSIK